MARRIALIGAPLCDGEREEGVEKAPGALRAAGLLESLRSLAEVHDFGDLPLAAPIPDRKTGKLRNLENNLIGCQKIMKVITDSLRDDYFPLVIGGDCSLFPGAIAGVKAIHETARAIYFDGDTDFHTPETTTSGYLSGMDLATAVGRGPEQLRRIAARFPIIGEGEVLVLGARKNKVDPLEMENLRHSSVPVVWFEELTEQKVNNVVKGEIDASKPVYLHFDLDVIDSLCMPVLAGAKSGVHPSGGLSYAEAWTICKTLAKLPLIGMEVTLYDPNLDTGGVFAMRIIRLIEAVLGANA